jgi:hypothetical protein
MNAGGGGGLFITQEAEQHMSSDKLRVRAGFMESFFGLRAHVQCAWRVGPWPPPQDGWW